MRFSKEPKWHLRTPKLEVPNWHLKFGYGGRRYLPFAFTENGVAMLSSVLNSKRAIQVNIQIMRAFTKIRDWLATHQDLQEKIKKIERKFDKKFAVVFRAIQLLLDGPQKPVYVKGFGK